jgi:hypothetical protein
LCTSFIWNLEWWFCIPWQKVVGVFVLRFRAPASIPSYRRSVVAASFSMDRIEYDRVLWFSSVRRSLVNYSNRNTLWKVESFFERYVVKLAAVGLLGRRKSSCLDLRKKDSVTLFLNKSISDRNDIKVVTNDVIIMKESLVQWSEWLYKSRCDHIRESRCAGRSWMLKCRLS